VSFVISVFLWFNNWNKTEYFHFYY